MFAKYVSFPYLTANEDGSTNRNWAHMTFKSEERIDRRAVKRAIRKWVKHNLERTLHCNELAMITKRVQFEKTNT